MPGVVYVAGVFVMVSVFAVHCLNSVVAMPLITGMCVLMVGAFSGGLRLRMSRGMMIVHDLLSKSLGVRRMVILYCSVLV